MTEITNNAAAGFLESQPELPIIRIEPPTGVSINFREMWAYRELLYFLIWRDIKVRYKQTILGVAWAVLQPLLTMVIFSLFFGRLAKMAVGRHSIPGVRAGWCWFRGYSLPTG